MQLARLVVKKLEVEGKEKKKKEKNLKSLLQKYRIFPFASFAIVYL